MKSNYQIAQEVINGAWGNGEERRTRLYNAGYDPNAVQSIVNAMIYDRQSIAEAEQYLTVEVDLSKYSGINLKFKKG